MQPPKRPLRPRRSPTARARVSLLFGCLHASLIHLALDRPYAESNCRYRQRLRRLATAIRLQAKGFQVRVFESRAQPGGRAYVYRQDGFTFDGGPTVITAPFLIDELFDAPARTADYIGLVPVDPFYRIEFHDGRAFEYGGDETETERRVAAFSPGDLDGYRRCRSYEGHLRKWLHRACRQAISQILRHAARGARS